MATFLANATFDARLENFYKQHQPAHINSIPQLLLKVNGDPKRFEKLMSKLVERYGPEPDVDDETLDAVKERYLHVGTDGRGEDEEAFGERLRRMYIEYAPTKVLKVRTLLKKTLGKESHQVRLMNMLTSKYGREIVEEPKASEKNSNVQKKSFRSRLIRFYEHYAPEKMENVDILLARAQGKSMFQKEIMLKLVDKYGPEPVDEEDGDMEGSDNAESDEDDDDEESEDDEEEEEDPFRARLVAFYTKYQPEKIHDIESLLAKTQGIEARENKLMSQLIGKYGPEPDSTPTMDPEEELRRRLTRFYKAYQPEKLGDVENFVQRAVGQPDQIAMLFKRLQVKYGPEPPGPGEPGYEDSENEKSDDESQMAAKEAEGDEEEDDDDDEEDDSVLRKMVYCPVDGFPPEYSEYLPTFHSCLPWMLENCPDLVLTTKGDITVAEYCEKLQADGVEIEAAAAETSAKRGGLGQANKKKGGKKKPDDPQVVMELVKKNKRRSVTIVTGLEHFDVKLKEAAKAIGRKFACGASIQKLPSGVQAIEIQGDVIFDLPGAIISQYKSVPASALFVLEGGSKTQAKIY